MLVKNEQGFTLIELLMVAGLIGILAALAIPAHHRYVLRGNLLDASIQLASTRMQLEQFFQDHRVYDNSTGGISPCPAPTQFFSFSCSVSSASYVVTASNNAGQDMGNAGDYQYTIDENNTKETTRFEGKPSRAACWILEKADQC